LDQTSFSDATISSHRFYMVRAVKLETSGSGTYYNASQGSFAEAELGQPFSNLNIWPGRGTGIWRIHNAVTTDGSNSGWDSTLIAGNLNVAGTADNQFTVWVLSSGSDGTPGPPDNFNNDHRYAWPILTGSAPVVGFSPSKINLVTSQFSADLAGGTFALALSQDERSVNLQFTPNHAPVANLALFHRAWDIPLRVEIDDLLAQFTSDPDGDARALLHVGSSTNGTSITCDGTALLFAFGNNLPETIPYWIQDIREYRPGDTVRTAMGSIRIDPLPSSLPFNAYHAIEIEWQGEPGKLYQLQSRLTAESEWVNEGEPFFGTGEKSSRFERTSNTTKFYRIVPQE
jgi:hypothetical protein